MFDLDINPYVNKIKKHKDIIHTLSLDGKPEIEVLPGSSRPLIVDLGCGSGNFLRDYALSAPEYDFFGFELRYKRLVKGAVKIKKRGVGNVRFIQDRAEYIDRWFPACSLKEVNINFPDPWPKKRHRKHRLITAAYLEKLRLLLKKNGWLAVKTDHREYFGAITDLIKDQSSFQIIEYSENLHNSDYSVRNIPTEFELLFKNKGDRIYYLKAETSKY